MRPKPHFTYFLKALPLLPVRLTAVEKVPYHWDVPDSKAYETVKKRESDLNQKLFPFEIIHTTGPANNMAFFHWHDFMEITHVKKGAGKYKIEDKTFSVQEGDIVVINNIERHRVTYSPERPLYETVFHFAPSLIWSKENSYFDHSYLKLFLYQGVRFDNKPELDPSTREIVAALIHDMVEEYARQQQYFELMIKSKLLTLITHLIRCCGIDSENGDAYLHRKKNIERIEEILTYINTNFAENITLPSLAQQFFISPSYFSDFFRKNIGINFIEYLNRTRISEAIRLLNENRLNSTEVALAVGFNNMASYYTAFKKLTGKNPGQYRKAKKTI